MGNVVDFALYVFAREAVTHPYVNGDHVNAVWKDGHAYPGTYRGTHGGKAKVEWHDGSGVNHIDHKDLTPRMTPAQQARHDESTRKFNEVKQKLDVHEQRIQHEQIHRQVHEEVRRHLQDSMEGVKQEIHQRVKDFRDGYGPKHLYKNPAHWKGDVRPPPKPEPVKNPGFFHRLLKRA